MFLALCRPGLFKLHCIDMRALFFVPMRFFVKSLDFFRLSLYIYTYILVCGFLLERGCIIEKKRYYRFKKYLR